MICLPADRPHQKAHRHGHHDELRDGLRLDHTAESKESVQDQKKRHIQDELPDKGDPKRVLRFAHSLEGHSAHGDRSYKRQNEHDVAQHPASCRDDLRRLREDSDQLRREYAVDSHDAEFCAAYNHNARLQDIQHTPVILCAVIVAHDRLRPGGKTLIDIVAQREDLLRDAHGRDGQFAVLHSQVVVDDVGSGSKEGLHGRRHADPEDLAQDLCGRADVSA